MNLNKLAADIYEGNKSRGFHDKPQEIGTYLMLMVSELGEALEADRLGNHIENGALERVIQQDAERAGVISDDSTRYSQATLDIAFAADFKTQIKDTHEDEIADTLIRILDYCGLKGIDIQGHMEAKLRYNSTRPNKHGKAY